jgi:hypothetical protein
MYDAGSGSEAAGTSIIHIPSLLPQAEKIEMYIPFYAFCRQNA